MIPFNSTAEIEIFIDQIKKFLTHETKASLNLIQALLTNHATQAKTVTELSLSKYFKRAFSSVFRAISGYYTTRKNKENRAESRQKRRTQILDFLLKSALSPNNRVYRFFLDMTGIIKKHSPKTPDRSYIYSSGNIDVGHLYSSVCLGAGKGWMLPMSMERVPSTKNKIEFAVSQIVPMIKKIPKKSLTVCVGDSGYCCNKFIHPLSGYNDVVTITRVRSNKVMFSKYVDSKKGPGKKRVYGDKYCLAKGPLPEPDSIKTIEEKTSKGKVQKVKISLYKNYICRGSKGHKMSEVPTNFVRVEVYNEDGTKKYDRDLWVEVVGKRKDELTLEDVYFGYKERFDIEHFFKFGKSRLLMGKFQTTDPQKEEDFILFGMIAYHLLYYCRTLLNNVNLRKWENKKRVNLCSPWRVFRSAANSDIFDVIEKAPLKKRGIPTDKNIRKTFTQSPDQPIVRKIADQPKLEISIKSTFEKVVRFAKTSINMDPTSGELPLEQITNKMQEACIKVWPQAG